MPKRPSSKPAIRLITHALVHKGVAGDTVELPEHFLADHYKDSEELHVGWWKQLKELSADELRVLAFSALRSVQSLEAQRHELRSEIERRDQLRTQRGKAAQLPAVQEFKTWVKGQWALVKDSHSRGALTEFARRMISRKGAPIADTKTVLRWCREWEAERKRAAGLSFPWYESDGIPCEDVYDQVGLCRDPIPSGNNDDPDKPPSYWHIARF